MAILSMSRTVIYEQIRAGRLEVVHQGRRCYVTAAAMERATWCCWSRKLATVPFTVEDALRDWLAFGLSGRDPKTVEASRTLIERRIVPGLGRRRL